MRAFRVADRRFPLFDGTGARIVGGRWNSPGRPLIYAAESFAGAVLEVLVHANLGRVPRTHAGITITIPETIRIERVRGEDLAGWDAEGQRVSRDFGNRWLEEERSCVLLVPSLVTRGREHNVLINPDHGDFGQIIASEPEGLQWDGRLFQRK